MKVKNPETVGPKKGPNAERSKSPGPLMLDALKEFAEAIPLLVWIADPSGKVIYCNWMSSDYSESATDEHGGWHWEQLIHSEHLASSVAKLKRSIRLGAGYEKEHLLRMADGTYQWHLTRIVPKVSGDDAVACWFGTATNIHDRKVSEVEHPDDAAPPSERLAQKVEDRTKRLTDVIKSLENKNQETALSRYNQRFLIEFSEKFASYDGHHGFFQSLVKFLYDLTKLDYILVGTADKDKDGKFCINTMAITAFGELTDNITYPMWKGPCYEVVKGTVYSYPSKCREIFNENPTLADFNVEGYLGYPLYDGNGNAAGLIALMHQKEIEDHETIASILRIVAKRAEFELDRIGYEKRLVRSNVELQSFANRLQSTFDGVPTMIALLEVVHDDHHHPVDFVISAANKATADFTGCSTRDLMGKTMIALYPESFRGELMDSYLKVFDTGEPLYLEFLNTGLNRWFSIFVTKQVDGSGLVSAALEITEQKKGEEERRQNLLLAELDHAKTEFFSNVSHEFRTPLTLILGPLTDVMTMLDKRVGMSEELERLRFVERNALRLQKLVNTLLEFSRIEAGRNDAVFQPSDIAEYTALLASNFRSVIEQTGLKFVVHCESVEPVYINLDMWEKIVLNLISNAFKFTFEGKIEVLIKDYKRHVQLVVEDSGVGISEANLPRIFERFARVTASRCRTYEGSGIGLALVKELVSMHRGSIKVKSKEGQGTVITVSILKGKAHLPPNSIHELKEKRILSPLASAFESEAVGWLPDLFVRTPPGKASPSDDCRSIKRILLVDDNSDLREYIKKILSERYTIFTASNGRYALELIQNGVRPDLILADVMMPEMDGYALLSELRSSSIPEIPVIMLTSKASEEARIEGMRHGADDYIAKPFSPRELIARIDSRIRSAAARATV